MNSKDSWNEPSNMYCVVDTKYVCTFQSRIEYLIQILEAFKYDAHKMTQIRCISSEAKNTLQHQFY